MSSKIYYQNNKNKNKNKNASKNNSAPYVREIRSFAKLKNADEIRKIVNLYKTEIQKEGNLISNLHYSSLKLRPFKHIVKSHTVDKYYKMSGYNYEQGLNLINPKFLNSKGELSESFLKYTLNKVEENLGYNNRLLPSNVIILDNEEQREKILSAPKRALAFSYINSYNVDYEKNILQVSTLLESKIDNKRHLYLMMETYKENSPDSSFSLYLLPHGLLTGIKPLFRLDLVGHMTPEYLQQNGIEHALNQYLYNTLDPRKSHANFMSQHEVDKFIPNLKSSASNHLHISSPIQDYTMALCSYLKDNHVVYTKVDPSKLSAVDYDIYSDLYPNETQRSNQMYNDAKQNNGLIPHERMYEAVQKLFNITSNPYNKEMHTEIDEGRNRASGRGLPVADYFFKEAYGSLKLHNNGNDIAYVHTIGKLLKPVNQFYRYTNRHEFLNFNFLQEKAETDPYYKNLMENKRRDAQEAYNKNRKPVTKEQNPRNNSHSQQQPNRTGEKHAPNIKSKKEYRAETKQEIKTLIKDYYKQNNNNLTSEQIEKIDEKELVKELIRK